LKPRESWRESRISFIQNRKENHRNKGSISYRINSFFKPPLISWINPRLIPWRSLSLEERVRYETYLTSLF
jgi:hypothetical protein